MLEATLLENANVDYLDEVLLQENGQMRLHTAAFYQNHVHPDHLSIWCVRRARYGIPTVELVEYLKERIAGRTAIEVAAGMGDLAFHLGIPASDSRIQERCNDTNYGHAVRSLYALSGAALTKPPSWVKKLDAEGAVRKYRPQVIIASWLTQKYRPGDEGPPKIGSSVYGADEFYLIQNCEAYIHIGNARPHGTKRILRLPHAETRAEWLISRSQPENNVIWEWKGAKAP